MSLPHLQDPATPDANDAPTHYRMPGVIRSVALQLAAAIERGDHQYAEAARYALNAVAAPPAASAPAPAPVRPGYITGAVSMTPDELSERIAHYFATVDPSASFSEASAHAARCGLVVIR